MRNDKLIPTTTYSYNKKKYNGSEEWKNFSRRICRNPFVKNFLKDRDGNFCQWCGRNFYVEPVVHHINYNNLCKYKTTIRVSHPTPKRPNGTRKIPNCEECSQKFPSAFESCIKKLALVHNRCNKEISEATRFY